MIYSVPFTSPFDQEAYGVQIILRPDVIFCPAEQYFRRTLGPRVNPHSSKNSPSTSKVFASSPQALGGKGSDELREIEKDTASVSREVEQITAFVSDKEEDEETQKARRAQERRRLFQQQMQEQQPHEQEPQVPN